MAWEWSHTAEGLEGARYRLGRLTHLSLCEIYSEWKCHEITEAKERLGAHIQEADADIEIPNELTTEPLLDGRGDLFKKTARNQFDKEGLADWIWERAEAQTTCENGGRLLWMCPHGCGPHCVPPEPKKQ